MAALSPPSLPLPSSLPSSSTPKSDLQIKSRSGPSPVPAKQLHARALRQLTTVSFNHAIRAYTSISHHRNALYLYLSMLEFDIVPNEHTFPSVIKSCVSLNLLSLCHQIHASLVKLGLFPSNIFCACSILDLYVKHASLDHALLMFERIPQRNSVTWNQMIKAYSQNGYLEKGLILDHLRLDMIFNTSPL
jgi:pentatricopeptide repeat protein